MGSKTRKLRQRARGTVLPVVRVIGFGRPGVVKVTHPSLPPGRYTLKQAGLRFDGAPSIAWVEVVGPESAGG